ncbi:MAG: glutaredoxin family protein [Candidatus Diapherotrites archaeon]|nr:glutaredoxin family protein [Candidatus Diapherotrites archaeon]
MSVIVYSTNACPFCIMAKQYLKQKGVSFNEINVDEDEVKAKEMIEKSGQQGVPVLDINGVIIIGFNKPKIDEALKNLKD